MEHVSNHQLIVSIYATTVLSTGRHTHSGCSQLMYILQRERERQRERQRERERRYSGTCIQSSINCVYLRYNSTKYRTSYTQWMLTINVYTTEREREKRYSGTCIQSSIKYQVSNLGSFIMYKMYWVYST